MSRLTRKNFIVFKFSDQLTHGMDDLCFATRFRISMYLLLSDYYFVSPSIVLYFPPVASIYLLNFPDTSMYDSLFALTFSVTSVFESTFRSVKASACCTG